ncbi:MAG: N-formylglutamate amidohydrolase [Rubrivivax sp.]
MDDDTILTIHGPAVAALPLVLDSPHSGQRMPPDFGSIRSVAELREGEDSFIDALFMPAVARGVPLLAAQFPRTYLDANRHAGDIDPELMDAPWPQPLNLSTKAGIGKALVWRCLDADRPLYDRRLTVAEVQHRIDRCHTPYHAALRRLLDGAHARHGVVHHFNCHSMPPNSSFLIEGVAGQPRADIVLGDRDGSTCAPAFTTFVHRHLAAAGLTVAVNDPYKGVELVRAYSDPAAGRHSLQIEINKRLYMDTATLQRNDGFERMQQVLLSLVDALASDFFIRAHHA